MGYAVFHLNKASGNDARTTAHIERTIDPKNADKTRTHLNKEFIEFPEGVTNRTQAIQYRLEHAGLTRKIGKNQVRVIQAMLSGTHEDMKRIEAEGKLDGWCHDNLEWLKKTFGAENIVSAVLHLDETTPHIHASIVPIVTGERRKANRDNQQGKKKYKKKNINAARLCSDDVMARDKLKEYQNTYAQVMNKYGLQRGIEGSQAKHITTVQYYRDLVVKTNDLQENIGVLANQQEQLCEEKEALSQQTEEAQKQYIQADAQAKEKESELREKQKELKQAKGQVRTEELKSSLVNTATNISDKVGSLFNNSKVKSLEEQNKDLQNQIDSLQVYVNEIKADHARQLTVSWKERQTVVNKLKQELTKIYDLFPKIKELLRIENLCSQIGFSNELTKMILEMKPVGFKGKLYSPEHKRSFETEHSVAEIKPHPTESNQLQLTIDGVSETNWLRQKYREFQQRIGINIKEPTVRRGIKL